MFSYFLLVVCLRMTEVFCCRCFVLVFVALLGLVGGENGDVQRLLLYCY